MEAEICIFKVMLDLHYNKFRIQDTTFNINRIRGSVELRK